MTMITSQTACSRASNDYDPNASAQKNDAIIGSEVILGTLARQIGSYLSNPNMQAFESVWTARFASRKQVSAQGVAEFISSLASADCGVDTDRQKIQKWAANFQTKLQQDEVSLDGGGAFWDSVTHHLTSPELRAEEKPTRMPVRPIRTDPALSLSPRSIVSSAGVPLNAASSRAITAKEASSMAVPAKAMASKVVSSNAAPSKVAPPPGKHFGAVPRRSGGGLTPPNRPTTPARPPQPSTRTAPHTSLANQRSIVGERIYPPPTKATPQPLTPPPASANRFLLQPQSSSLPSSDPALNLGLQSNSFPAREVDARPSLESHAKILRGTLLNIVNGRESNSEALCELLAQVGDHTSQPMTNHHLAACIEQLKEITKIWFPPAGSEARARLPHDARPPISGDSVAIIKNCLEALMHSSSAVQADELAALFPAIKQLVSDAAQARP